MHLECGPACTPGPRTEFPSHLLHRCTANNQSQERSFPGFTWTLVTNMAHIWHIWHTHCCCQNEVRTQPEVGWMWKWSNEAQSQVFCQNQKLNNLCHCHFNRCAEHLCLTTPIAEKCSCLVTTLGIPGLSCHNDPGVHEETRPWDLASPGESYSIIWPIVRKWNCFFKISGPDVFLSQAL